MNERLFNHKPQSILDTEVEPLRTQVIPVDKLKELKPVVPIPPSATVEDPEKAAAYKDKETAFKEIENIIAQNNGGVRVIKKGRVTIIANPNSPLRPM